jgi:hypothetical protein
MALQSLWLNIAIAPRFVISNASLNKISLLQSSQVLSHKPSLALVVAVAALVVVALAAALAVIAQAVVVVAMAPALVLRHALVVEVAVVAVVTLVEAAQVTPVQLAQRTHVLHVRPVLALPSQSLAANVATLAAAKYD